MTNTSEGARSTHAGIWHRATHALGKLLEKMIALPEAPAGARQKAPPPDYFMFPPF
jgi:hypothetical protein